SYEAPSLGGSANHDVYFQWWRYQPGSRTFAPEPAIRIFDSPNNTTAYSRAELTIDSTGRIWVQAFRLEAGGASTAVIAVSSDEGATFRHLAPLASVSRRGGGRLLALGDRVIFLWGMHDGFEPARFRIHLDDAAEDDWGPIRQAFPEGLYHGAALSAVATPEGGMHLVYKGEIDQRLYYRYFDGATFSARVPLGAAPTWALQSATTLIGEDLYVFFNHGLSDTHYEIRYRVLRDGVFTPPQVVDGSSGWKGYLAAVATLPGKDTVPEVPVFYGATLNANVSGEVRLALVPNASEGSPPPDDDGGDGDGCDDGDEGDEEPPPAPILRFEDAFERSA